MGNCSCILSSGSIGFQDHRLVSIDADDATHEGIRIVSAEKVCQFSTGCALCVCIVTWNMNGKASYDDLAEIIGRDRNFDLLVIGLQEAPRIGAVQVLQSALAGTHRLLGEATMQSLKLFLFGANSAVSYIREIRVDKQGVGGCGGLIGRKKGAVALYVNFSGISMVFVSCHLAAHERNVDERNSECKHISHSLFSRDQYHYAGRSHVTVWLGDLNYRLQGIKTMPARSLIHENLYRTSKPYLATIGARELLQEAERGQVFNGYCEGTLSFKPTYKYNVGSSSYDTSYKIRVPSWTDRILFKVDHDSGIEAILNSYESIDHIKSSDHKPVKARLCLKVKDSRKSTAQHCEPEV